jgi:glyoxylase-like metal-dependent hydrolase (beta-lactamase superfamily II)
MIVQPFPSGPVSTNAYVIACKQSKKAAIVDPSPGSFALLAEFIAEGKFILEKILVTHSHWDHIADVAKCKSHFGIPIPLWMHALDKPNMEMPGADGLGGGMAVEAASVDHLVEEGEHFHIGEIEFEVICTPGHSPGGVCYYAAQAKLLLSGDTLFQGSMGRLDLPTGDAGAMWSSLKRLARLPSDTLVYPGHGPHTTIGAEQWMAEAEKYFS